MIGRIRRFFHELRKRRDLKKIDHTMDDFSRVAHKWDNQRRAKDAQDNTDNTE